MTTTSSPLARLGFDGPRLSFTLRTAFAAVLALVVASLLGIANPQWAAMTVWVVAQPTRGQLLEKGAFRVAGTLAGAVVGVGLMLASGDTPGLLVLGLAVWIGLCAGAGNLLGGFTGYGTILAGYSAAMVALIDIGHPGHIYGLAIDRVATICLGVAVSFAVGWLFTPATAEADLQGRTRRLTARVLRHLALALDCADFPRFFASEQAILSEMAAIDEALDAHGAGSARNRRGAHRARALLAAALSLLVLARGRVGSTPSAPLKKDGSAGLLAAADALDAAAPDLTPLVQLAEHRRREPESVALAGALGMLATAAQAALNSPAPATAAGPDPAAAAEEPWLLRHQDVVGARIAALRAAAAVALVGAIWLATGWTYGPFMLLGAAIMTSLFSTFDNPALTMRFVISGTAAGALAALVARGLVLPFAGSLPEVIALTVPFIVIGGFIMAHRVTMLAGMDYNMALLLLLQPAFPLHGTPAGMAQMALAMVLGPVIALIAFRLAFPMDARARRAMLIGMMVHELELMARTPFDAARVSRWRARLYHRLLRLVRWSEKSGDRDFAAMEGGLAALAVGTAIRTLHELQAAPGRSDSLARGRAAALASLRRLSSEPERVADAFDRAALRLARAGLDGAEPLRRAAAAVRSNAAFFRLTSHAPARRAALSSAAA